MRLIARNELSTLVVNKYLSYRWRLEMILSLQNHASFLLEHFADKGDHILVDEDFNITGIIH